MKQTRRTMLQSTFAFVRMPHILCNPALATPGLQLINAEDLKNFWRSDHYGKLSKGVLSRPAFVIDRSWHPRHAQKASFPMPGIGTRS
jgi:hypothetical protein